MRQIVSRVFGKKGSFSSEWLMQGAERAHMSVSVDAARSQARYVTGTVWLSSGIFPEDIDGYRPKINRLICNSSDFTTLLGGVK